MTDLETNLNEEADKKGLTGEAREHYIGGTIEKIKERKKPFRRKTENEYNFEGYINTQSQHIKSEAVKARYDNIMKDLDSYYGSGDTYTYDELVGYVGNQKITKKTTEKKSDRAYAMAVSDKPWSKEQEEKHKENVKQVQERHDALLKKAEIELAQTSSKPEKKPLQHKEKTEDEIKAHKEARNAKQRDARQKAKQQEEERKQNTRTVTIRLYTDAEIEQFKKQVAQNDEQIKHYKAIMNATDKSSYKHISSANNIYKLNTENDVLIRKQHATTQTSYSRYKSNYPNHALLAS